MTDAMTLEAPQDQRVSPDASTAQVSPDMLVKAVSLQGTGREAEAEAMFRAYLAAKPHDPVAVYSLCVILMKRGATREAHDWLAPAVQKNPSFAPTWVAYGSVLQSLGERDASLQAYDQALAIKPDYIEALINSGAVLRETHQHAKALERFNQALIINPDHQTALGNCAIILTEFKQSDKAIAMFKRLLELNPDYDFGQGLLCYERLHICDWTDFDLSRDRIIAEVRAGKRSCKSLGFMALSDDAADHQTCARTFAQRFPVGNAPLWRGERYQHDRIRIAYVSADLREHPVGHLMAGIFEHHDRQRFETVAISLGAADQSRLRARMESAFEHFVDARAMKTRDIAQKMREMEIDIAIDLGGYTSDSRTEIFTWRPAPAHVNYLGYPGTMGLGCMDYIIADRHVIPPEHQPYYDERVIYLPDSYLPTASGIELPAETPTRAGCGLPDEGMVFCSFNHDYKISPHVFAVWMNMLKAVPGSVLWLMSRNEYSQRNLREHATSHGVSPERLVFASRVPRVEDHLARYRQADLFLDTHPYNAHTTAADALMAGLPVLTYMGQAFPARVAGSLLNTLGMNELITHSLADYERRGIELALNPAMRAAVRQKLAQQKQHTQLFNAAALCRNLEAIYTSIWRQQQLCDANDELGL